MAGSSDEDSNKSSWINNQSEESGSWCTKCETFFEHCVQLASQFNFSVTGKMYDSKLAFRCPAGRHDTKISYSRRFDVKTALQCIGCKKAEREDIKAN